MTAIVVRSTLVGSVVLLAIAAAPAAAQRPAAVGLGLGASVESTPAGVRAVAVPVSIELSAAVAEREVEIAILIKRKPPAAVVLIGLREEEDSLTRGGVGDVGVAGGDLKAGEVGVAAGSGVVRDVEVAVGRVVGVKGDAEKTPFEPRGIHQRADVEEGHGVHDAGVEVEDLDASAPLGDEKTMEVAGSVRDVKRLGETRRDPGRRERLGEGGSDKGRRGDRAGGERSDKSGHGGTPQGKMSRVNDPVRDQLFAL